MPLKTQAELATDAFIMSCQIEGANQIEGTNPPQLAGICDSSVKNEGEII